MGAIPDTNSYPDINAQLANGWHCHAVSTLTPGTVRLQLGDGRVLSALGYRASVEGATLDEAIEKAAEFSRLQTPAEYFGD